VHTFLEILYIKDLPPTINAMSVTELFANATRIITYAADNNCLVNVANDIFIHRNIQFTANELTLNFDGTNMITFVTTYKPVPNVVVEWITLLLRIQKVPGSNLFPETGCPD
jgi:hypothetical protein